MSNYTQAPPVDNPEQLVSIQIDDQTLPVDPVWLSQPEILQQLQNQIAAAQLVAIPNWEQVPHLPAPAVLAIVRLLRIEGPEVRILVGQNVYQNPLAATLSLPLDANNLDSVSRTTYVAICAAALFFQDAASAAAGQIRDWQKRFGVNPESVARIAKRIREVAGDPVSNGTAPTPQQLANVVLGALQATRGDHASLTPPLRRWKQYWYQSINGVWNALDDDALTTLVIQRLQAESVETPLTTNVIKSTILNIAAKVDFPIERAPVYVRAEHPEPLDVVEQQVLLCRNYTFDFSDWTVKAHDPRLFAPMRIPHDYDHQATCPLWEQTLAEIFPQESSGDHRIQILQEYVGYSLMFWDFFAQTFVVLTGEGANGKSTILDTVRHLLGNTNVSAVSLNSMHGEFRTAEMQGKFANIADDLPRMEKSEEGLLKQLVAGAPTSVNRKHRDPVTMYPTAKLYFAANDLPPISDNSFGMWRRLLLVPFRERFTPGVNQHDPDRPARLRSEVSGILNWALAGAWRLKDQGRFTECAVCEEAKRQYQADVDNVLQFLGDCCTFGVTLAVPTSTLYEAYRQYCASNGFRGVKNKSNFRIQICKQPGVTISRPRANGARLRVYEGIGLAGGLSVQSPRGLITSPGYGDEHGPSGPAAVQPTWSR